MNQMRCGTVELPFIKQINMGTGGCEVGSPEPCPMNQSALHPTQAHPQNPGGSFLNLNQKTWL